MYLRGNLGNNYIPLALRRVFLLSSWQIGGVATGKCNLPGRGGRAAGVGWGWGGVGLGWVRL